MQSCRQPAASSAVRVLEEWELLAQPRRRRAAGQLGPVPRQVAPGRRSPHRGGHLGERPAAQQRARDASKRATRWYSFGARPVSCSHQRAEPPPAVADLLGRRPATRCAPGEPRPAPGPPRPAGRASPCRASAATSARATTAGPSSRRSARRAAPAGRRSVGRRRRRARAARRPARAAGTPSSARAPAVVRPSWTPALAARRGGSPPEPRAARRPSTTASRARRAVRPAHVERLAHRQHEGQARRRQPPVHPRRAEVDVVGHQRGDVRRQRCRHGCHARDPIDSRGAIVR